MDLNLERRSYESLRLDRYAAKIRGGESKAPHAALPPAEYYGRLHSLTVQIVLDAQESARKLSADFTEANAPYEWKTLAGYAPRLIECELPADDYWLLPNVRCLEDTGFDGKATCEVLFVMPHARRPDLPRIGHKPTVHAFFARKAFAKLTDDDKLLLADFHMVIGALCAMRDCKNVAHFPFGGSSTLAQAFHAT